MGNESVPAKVRMSDGLGGNAQTNARERPILFSGVMVRELLAGKKTQTRRAVTPQPEISHDGEPYWHIGGYRVWGYRPPSAVPLRAGGHPLPCPYGKPGDRLWVREAWRASSAHDGLAPRDIPQGDAIEYGADHERVLTGKQRPSMFMPRWACRLVLTVTQVRVERLQDISASDSIAEGAGFDPLYGGHSLPDGSHFHASDPRISYWSLWGAINGAGSVEANPWVWVVGLRC